VIQLTPGMSATVFDVWAYVAVKMHRIDLMEEVNRLDPMQGTIIAQAGISVSTAGVNAVTTINGRALCLNGPVTIVNTVINVPSP
jgi:hypothetical protein